MAQIKGIYFDGVLTYPLSITDAVIDTKTSKTLTDRLEDFEYESIPLSAITELMNMEENNSNGNG